MSLNECGGKGDDEYTVLADSCQSSGGECVRDVKSILKPFSILNEVNEKSFLK